MNKSDIMQEKAEVAHQLSLMPDATNKEKFEVVLYETSGFDEETLIQDTLKPVSNTHMYRNALEALSEAVYHHQVFADAPDNVQEALSYAQDVLEL